MTRPFSVVHMWAWVWGYTCRYTCKYTHTYPTHLHPSTPSHALYRFHTQPHPSTDSTSSYIQPHPSTPIHNHPHLSTTTYPSPHTLWDGTSCCGECVSMYSCARPTPLNLIPPSLVRRGSRTRVCVWGWGGGLSSSSNRFFNLGVMEGEYL